MMVAEELGEYCDAYRKGGIEPRQVEGFDVLPEWEGKCLKPEGLPSEMTDVIINICDIAQEMNIDLTEAIKLKMEFNTKRNHVRNSRKRYVANLHSKTD